MSPMHFALMSAFVLALSAPSATAAENRHEGNDDRYISMELNYADPDELRRIDGNGLGATFRYGFGLNESWFLEARLTGLVLERGETGGTDFYQQDLGVDALYRFGDRAGWQPYAVAGISVIRNDVDVESLDDVNLGMNVGAGITSPPLGDLDVRFRTEVRYVRDDYLDGMQDARFGIGLQIPLGGRSRTAVVSGGGTSSMPADSDSDGIANSMDRCPGSLSYVKHDASGCMLPNQTIRMYEVTFDNGTSVLTTAARAELADVVLALRGQPDLRVRVDGHTDAWGSAEENRQLSLERAEAVATWLALQGVSSQRLTVKGFGESRPVDSNSTAAGRERNRRIEIVLLEPPQH